MGLSLPRFSRRRFLGFSLLASPALVAADAFGVEPDWLKVRTQRLTAGTVRHRFVHFTDVHFKGDHGYLEEVVRRINALQPDFVCFTGDLIEEAEYLEPALDLLREIKAPLYGIPGNHDHWSSADLGPAADVFAATGGAWLPDEQLAIRGGEINLIGLDRLPARFVTLRHAFNLLLLHYPGWTRLLEGRVVDLALAGHTHGGQVRLPFIGSLITPSHTDGYDLGWFDTPAGRLYVNPGIGTLGALNVRFNCRPELTLFEL